MRNNFKHPTLPYILTIVMLIQASTCSSCLCRRCGRCMYRSKCSWGGSTCHWSKNTRVGRSKMRVIQSWLYQSP